jgi:hypothetical protein
MGVNSETSPADRPASALSDGRSLAQVRPLGALDVVLLSAWCGLGAGWLEVGVRVLAKSILTSNRMYLMSRHFVWLVPLTNFLLFIVIGLFLAVATRLCGRPAARASPRLLCALALTPAFMVAVPLVYPLALLVLASGIAVLGVPLLETPESRWRRWLTLTLPGLLGLVAVVAGLIVGGDRLKQMREAGRPLPPASLPNVLLVVLDTVRADRLSLYGYPRPTTPALKALAKRGIRFDEARATAAWTLPSHASMFTGRLPHEQGRDWKAALEMDAPTIAEYLGQKGYATAGFVANTDYCSYDTGLDRGFTHFEDYVSDMEHLRPLRTALLFERAWNGISWLATRISRGRLGPLVVWLRAPVRKDARVINREFFGWLAERKDRRRAR